MPKNLWLRASVLAVAGTALASQLVAPASAAGPVVAPPASIAADCSRDVSQQLNTFFAGVPSHSVVQLPAGACYRTETEVIIRNKAGLVLEGNGAVLRRTALSPQALRYPQANAHLRFIGLTDSVISGLHVVGTNTVSDLPTPGNPYGAYDVQFEFEHAFSFHGARNVALRDSSADSVWGDGVNITGIDQYSKSTSDGVRIERVSIARNGRQGITVIARNVLIDGAVIRSSRRSGIDLEPNTVDTPVVGVEIRNSRITSWLLAFASGGAGVVNDINIHDNVIERTGVPFVYVKASDGTRRSGWTVTGNTVLSELGSPASALRFVNVGNVLVADNSLKLAPTQSRSAVQASSGTSGLRIECNRFENAKPDFVDADASSSYTARANSLTSAPAPCTPPDRVQRDICPSTGSTSLLSRLRRCR